MLFANTKTWISVLLACSSIPAALSAPTSSPVNGVAIRDVISPPALVAEDISILEKDGESRVITERNAASDIHLAKRYLIGSPYQKRTIQVALKQAVHGITAGTVWAWEISYRYLSPTGGREGHVSGNLVNGPGAFSFTSFKIDQAFVTSVDGIVSAVFDAVIKTTNEKIQFALTWAEDFTTTGSTLENHGQSSSFTYFTPGGRQERLGQEFFKFAIHES
ncbi:uncharacterized protein EKO05_0010248 [Ascochyta rabiei]|uniref:uncharacterized protein n=1 Tax=Didymella rabiei TaxID=5454 RepID=UPI0018FF93A6|nr:uncharacterized protein EKO05_0010248 [Ascochyta rabiei]UPX20001.1 hypothetical protein EKO05_0010248 [Ascochyta rabiei]